jgi:ornithine cyclodeaminase/alanine dehydrogenase-like protein (mu-crystallin family)
VSEILGVKAPNGGLHVKAALLPNDHSYLVAKLNTNFPGNVRNFPLPTIQGVIVVCDAENGAPLAIMDSIEITIKRTAAASAVAAKYLARANSTTATICGCGVQGRAQLRAMSIVFELKKIHAFDRAQDAAEKFAAELSAELKLEIEPVRDVGRAIRQSDICVTCTPSCEFYVRKEDVAPGSFISAVGADNEDKQEIDPDLMASAKIVTDSLEQCSKIGDLHHALVRGLMRKEQVYAELAEIVVGRKPSRIDNEEIIIFDSTGVAVEDAVAAAAVYEKARAFGVGEHFRFAA